MVPPTSLRIGKHIKMDLEVRLAKTTADLRLWPTLWSWHMVLTFCLKKLQGSPFITLCLGSIKLDHVISESCCKGIISILLCYNQNCVIMSSVIEGLKCTFFPSSIFSFFSYSFFVYLSNQRKVQTFDYFSHTAFGMVMLLQKTIWAPSWENLFLPYANNKGADQPAHQRSLISAFVVRCLDSIIPLLARAEISRP